MENITTTPPRSEARRSLLKVEEVAHDLNVCRRTVYELIRSGKLHKVKIGAAVRIPADEVARFIEAEKV